MPPIRTVDKAPVAVTSYDPVTPGIGAGCEPPAHYDRVTPAWTYLLGENLHYGLFATGEEPLADATEALTLRLAGHASLAEGLAVLDVGCGTGAPACLLAERFGCRVLGISTSPVGVERARSRAAERGLQDRVSFALGNGMENGLGSCSFDRVWVMESSHLMPNKEQLLAECARVLKPGGRLALCDLVLKHPMTTRDVVALRDELLLLRDVFGRAKMEPVEWYSAVLRRLGFVRIETEDLTAATFGTFARWEENAERSRDECFHLFGESSWRQFVESVAVLRRFWRDGILGYALVAASLRDA